MKILSFDLGQINTAYSLFDVESDQLIKWGTIPLLKKQSTYTSVCDKLIKGLDREAILDDISDDVIILIELQPSSNIRTLIMSGQLHMYFNVLKTEGYFSNVIKVLFYHANNKLKYYKPRKGDPPVKTKYASKHYANKRIAVQHCTILLSLHGKEKDKKWLEFFNSKKKKDDYADVYLMGRKYMDDYRKGISYFEDDDISE